MNQHGYCPHCKADLDGDLIIEVFLKQGQPLEVAEEWASHYYGWEQYGKENKFGRKIGFYDMALDRTTGWRCPDCKGTWGKFG